MEKSEMGQSELTFKQNIKQLILIERKAKVEMETNARFKSWWAASKGEKTRTIRLGAT